MSYLIIKEQYAKQAAIYNHNLKVIKIQLSRQALESLKKEYNVTEDSHLAKKLMLKGIRL
jgi:hypothetical protein